MTKAERNNVLVREVATFIQKVVEISGEVEWGINKENRIRGKGSNVCPIMYWTGCEYYQIHWDEVKRETGLGEDAYFILIDALDNYKRPVAKMARREMLFLFGLVSKDLLMGNNDQGRD